MLTWKIVGASKASVLYIYIDNKKRSFVAYSKIESWEILIGYDNEEK